MTHLPPESTGGVKIIAISVIFTICAILAVSLRIVAARIQRRSFRLHDYLSFAALIFTVGFGVNAIIGVYLGGSGQHVKQITTDPHQGLETIIAGLKNFFVSAFVWACATCLCKLSILFLYMELFPNRFFHYTVYVMMSFVVAFWIGLILTGFLICRPIAFNWDKTLHGQCGSTADEEISFAVVNMIIDGMIVFLPMPVVWRLQMPVKKKISISCMFGLGLVICVMNAARIGVVVTADEADYSYALIDVVVFAGLEIWFGIIAACVPTLKPIFTSHRASTYDSPSSGYRDRGYKRSQPNALYPSEYGSSWELERTFQRRQRDELRGMRFDWLNDNDLPLRGGLTSPAQVRRTETIANTRGQRD